MWHDKCSYQSTCTQWNKSTNSCPKIVQETLTWNIIFRSYSQCTTCWHHQRQCTFCTVVWLIHGQYYEVCLSYHSEDAALTPLLRYYSCYTQITSDLQIGRLASLLIWCSFITTIRYATSFSYFTNKDSVLLIKTSDRQTNHTDTHTHTIMIASAYDFRKSQMCYLDYFY